MIVNYFYIIKISSFGSVLQNFGRNCAAGENPHGIFHLSTDIDDEVRVQVIPENSITSQTNALKQSFKSSTQWGVATHTSTIDC